jgi:hypothetical protein
VISSPLGINGSLSQNNNNNNIVNVNFNRNSRNFSLNNQRIETGSTSLGNGSGASTMFANVAITFDRKRITGCNCTCSKQEIAWCAHIVAVCLYRILQVQNDNFTNGSRLNCDNSLIEVRPPISESLSKLQRDQLQKFAQYLISELPQQILPTAQKLLDELLKSNTTSINMLCGAPDPTAGPSQHDISLWCLDEQILQENIHKTLTKFILPTPNVVSDIECLEQGSSATAAEYTNLLRPLRGREPEAMWNLISIVREMFRRRDKNTILMLKIITKECINIDSIINLWFLVKVSQILHHQKHQQIQPINNKSNQWNPTRNNSNFATSHPNSTAAAAAASISSNFTHPVNQACASLMDEIVKLWQLACLNPQYNSEEKVVFCEQLNEWNNLIIEKLKKFSALISIDEVNINNNNNNFFSHRTWPAISLAFAILRRYSIRSREEKLIEIIESKQFQAFVPAIDACHMNWENFNFLSLSQFRDDCLDLISSTFDSLKSLEVLFLRCEALFSHGFNEQACCLAQILVDFMLNKKLYQNDQKEMVEEEEEGAILNDKLFTLNFENTILWRSSLLCYILYESSLLLPKQTEIELSK